MYLTGILESNSALISNGYDQFRQKSISLYHACEDVLLVHVQQVQSSSIVIMMVLSLLLILIGENASPSSRCTIVLMRQFVLI